MGWYSNCVGLFHSTPSGRQDARRSWLADPAVSRNSLRRRFQHDVADLDVAHTLCHLHLRVLIQTYLLLPPHPFFLYVNTHRAKGRANAGWGAYRYYPHKHICRKATGRKWNCKPTIGISVLPPRPESGLLSGIESILWVLKHSKAEPY